MKLDGVRLYLLLATVLAAQGEFKFLTSNEEKHERGEKAFKEVVRLAQSSPCWKEAVDRLSGSCDVLQDIEQSRLAVTFANCHLSKSGRRIHACDGSMTIQECTGKMDAVAFHTYTEFYTHTINMCYFIQNALWQEKAENVINLLSETSAESVSKLQQSLELQEVINKKQNEVLGAFESLEELAYSNRDLLWQVHSSLKGSIEGIHYLLCLCLAEVVGIETFFVALVVWLVIQFLPRFNWSRLWLSVLLVLEQAIEVMLRRGMTHDAGTEIVSLYNVIWCCRYATLSLGVVTYLLMWHRHTTPMERVKRELNQKLNSILSILSESNASWDQCAKWRVRKFLESIPENAHGMHTITAQPEDDVASLWSCGSTVGWNTRDLTLTYTQDSDQLNLTEHGSLVCTTASMRDAGVKTKQKKVPKRHNLSLQIEPSQSSCRYHLRPRSKN